MKPSSDRKSAEDGEQPSLDQAEDNQVLRVVRPSRAGPADAARVTRAEIDLGRIRHNLHELRRCAATTGAAVWGVLKADGYGHGARNIATTLQQANIDGICVALLEEGLELRSAGVNCRILVMGGYYGHYRDGLEALVEHRLTPVVYESEQIESLNRTVSFMTAQSETAETPFPVHLKVDTGMGRLGVRPEKLAEVVRALQQAPHLHVEGLMTHLACADAPELETTRQQLQRHVEAESALARVGIRPSKRHAANTAAMLRLPKAQLDLVRPGLGLFGVHPCPEASTELLDQPKLRPVMRVLSEVVAIRQIQTGHAVGYGHTWRAPRASTIATIPMGYADGLNRNCSNGGQVLICGKRAPIVGTVSMDLTMVDVTDIDGVGLRDEVVVLGEQQGRLGRDCITAEELARSANSISWECLTSISRRVPRFYRNA